MRWRISPLAVLAIGVVASRLANAAAVHDGHFSIEIDTNGLCVILPAPPTPCVDGDADALASRALSATPNAATVFAAKKLEQFEVVDILRNYRVEKGELDGNEIAEGARNLTKATAKQPTVRAASEVTAREERVNGIQVVTYTTELQLDGSTGATKAILESHVLYGRNLSYSITIVADDANIADARARVMGAVETARLEPALRDAPSTKREWWWTLLGGFIGIELVRRYRKRSAAAAREASAASKTHGDVESKVCTSCNMTNDADAVFCNKCGAKIT
jgi:ribosomal protein L40E